MLSLSLSPRLLPPPLTTHAHTYALSFLSLTDPPSHFPPPPLLPHTHREYWQKINSKNAFEWNLIDYLSEICTTEDQDMPSFSTLANVIDASGEIYASKVVALAWCLADPALIATLLGCVAARSFGLAMYRTLH